MRIMHQGKEIGLDSRAAISFLSHAHADHLAHVNPNSVIASAETLALANLSEKNIRIDGIRLINAGHILGARQFVSEEETKTIYTGDISLKENIFGFKASVEECDKLIIESTYSSPEYRFQNPFEIYDEISAWVMKNKDKNILIGAYELGKAQEIVRVLNEYCNIAPLVTEKADYFCSVYELFGFNLDRIVIGSEEAEKEMNHPFVAIVPMRLAKKNFAHKLNEAFGRETLVCVATGWAIKFKYNVDRTFALSDHADFDDLAFYIEQSGAKRIEFFDGTGEQLLDKIRNQEKIIC